MRFSPCATSAASRCSRPGSENAAKYTPYVAVIRKVSPKLLGDLYFHYHPRFQQACEDLTKSDGRFDDRVLQAIPEGASPR